MGVAGLAVDYQDVLSRRVMAVQEQRSALVAAIEETRTARSLSFADDEHDPDGSTASLDQVRDAALLARVEDTLGELMAAQQRLAEGDFGPVRELRSVDPGRPVTCSTRNPLLCDLRGPPPWPLSPRRLKHQGRGVVDDSLRALWRCLAPRRNR